MTEPFVLELLPVRGLDQSMLLPVLIGLYTVLLGTEVFGWVFAGAIVPGYLASVFTIQPVTGVIVVFESLVTLLLSEAIAKLLSRTDAWTRFFGRERFFLIVMVSLIVRMHDHAWFAPWAIAQFDAWQGTNFETQQEFYSVGLVLVPLTANMLWKPPLHRGLMQLGVQVGITYLILAYILLPHTNLSLSSVELTYENAAVNFVGHAKAHMILLTAALLAAQLNLTYGWDFNGILVPALLAMLWLTPLKLLATISEAVVVFYLVKGFVKLPVIRHLDFEGPRKIVLVFTMAFFWKMLLGFTIGASLPNFKVSDAYGFGYLLSSLLAVKMIGVKSVRGVLLPSLTASAGGFVIGSAIGYLLDVVAPKPLPEEDIVRPESTRLTASPLGVMTLARTDVQLHRDELEPLSAADFGRLRKFWEAAATFESGRGMLGRMSASLSGNVGAQLGPMQRLGAELGLQIVELGSVRVGSVGVGSADTELDRGQVELGQVDRDWFAVVADEGTRRRGFTTALLSPDGLGPVLVVPMPASEAPTAEAAAIVCRRVDCRAVLVAGREVRRAGTRVNPRPIEIALEAFEAEEVVVLRADLGRAEPRYLGGYIGETIAAVQPEPEPILDPLDAETRIFQLRGRLDTTSVWPRYQLVWESLESIVRLPPGEERNFMVLRSTVAEMREFVLANAHEFDPPAAPAQAEPEPAAPEQADPEPAGAEPAGAEPAGAEPAGDEPTLIGPNVVYSIDALPSVLAEVQEQREPPGTWGKGYEPPSPAELLVIEQLIVEPLMRWADGSAIADPVPSEVRLYAGVLDYTLVEFNDCGREATCLVMLREASRPTTAGWGTLVVRRQRGASLHVVEVPRPFRELDTWRVGSELWQLLGGRALLLAGADGLPIDPEAAADVEDGKAGAEGLGLRASPDPVRPGNLTTPFQAIHQSLDRSAGAILDRSKGERFEVAQIRGIASYRPITRDVIVGIGLPAKGDLVEAECWSQLSPELELLVARWNSCQVANGSEDLYLLSGAGTPQVEYSTELGNANVRVLWMSAGLRERFSAPRSVAVDDGNVVHGLEQARFPVERVREIQALLEPMWPRESGVDPDGRPRVALGRQAFDDAIAAAVGYANTGNFHELRTLRAMRDAALDLRVTAGIGLDFGQPVLFIEYVGEALGKRAMVSLTPGLAGQVSSSAAVLDDVLHLRAELLTRPQVLIITDKPVVGFEGAPSNSEQERD